MQMSDIQVKYGKIMETTLLSKDTSTIMRNPSLLTQAKGLRMIVLVSVIEVDFLVSMIFRMVHPIPTSPLNDFCTCIIIVRAKYRINLKLPILHIIIS